MGAHRLVLLVAIGACSTPPARQVPAPVEAAPAPKTLELDAGPAIPARLRDATEAWAALRRCMVGDPPAAADPVDAHIARELLHGVDRCAAPHAQLAQRVQAAIDDPAGMPWDGVQQAIYALGSSWTDGETGEMILDAAGISGVDDAIAAVYRAAGVTPPSVPTGPSLPRLVPAPPLAATAGFGMSVSKTIDHVVDGWLMKGGTEGQGMLRATGPDDVEYTPYDAAEAPATPGAWTATTRGGKVIAGAVDRKGRIGRGATTVMRGRNLEVSTTLGTEQARAVVITREVGDAGFHRAWIVRSEDGGAHWEAPRPLADGHDAVVSLSRDAVDVYGNSPDGVTWQRITGPTDLPAPRLLPAGLDLGEKCSVGGVLWWMPADDGELHHLDRAGAVHALGHTGSIAACTADGIVLRTGDGLIACSATQCGPLSRHRGTWRVVDVWTPGQLVEATQQRHVIAVWEAGTPRLFQVDDAFLVAVVVWDGRTYLGLQVPGGISFTALP